MKPHLFLLAGVWHVSAMGRAHAMGDPSVRSRATFREACQLAQLAAIHSGAWRR